MKRSTSTKMEMVNAGLILHSILPEVPIRAVQSRIVLTRLRDSCCRVKLDGG